MLFPVLLAAAVAVADWVPARWNSNDPKSLELVTATPVNCLLVEESAWSAPFSAAAAARGVTVLGVVQGSPDPAAVVKKARGAELSGLVLEGDFPAEAPTTFASVGVIVLLPPRAGMRFDGTLPVAGTNQGVWPGVRMEARSAATGGPWIDTNSGFLRYVRAATDAPAWIANRPPERAVLPVERYLQAISDAATVGAHWVVALDSELNRRLLAREPKALDAWQRIGLQLRFFEEHKEWRALKPYGQLAIVEDPSSGALLSGGVLDMIAVKHTPVRPVPLPRLSEGSLKGASMAVNVDPESISPVQKEALRGFTRGGGTLLNAPPGWKFPPPDKERITLDKNELDQINDIWKNINGMIGYTNLGARLFNVGGMLSSLLGDAEGRRVVLQLTNYTSYPVEAVTVKMLGKYTRATLYAPGEPPRALETYATDDGTGIDLDRVSVSAAIVLE